MIFQTSMVKVLSWDVCKYYFYTHRAATTLNFSLPKTYGEQIQHDRGSLTQAGVPRNLGVERSCLSRYEREKLGVPVKVLNYCIGARAGQINASLEPIQNIEQAQAHARQTMSLLEVTSQTLQSSS